MTAAGKASRLFHVAIYDERVSGFEILVLVLCGKEWASNLTRDQVYALILPNVAGRLGDRKVGSRYDAKSRPIQQSAGSGAARARSS